MSLTSDQLQALARIDGSRDAWVVGGAIRDQLSNRLRPDTELDLAVSGGEAWVAQAASVLDASSVQISAAFPIWRIVRAGQTLADVWHLQTELANDLRRRDFTLNAMAVPLSDFARGEIESKLIDLHGGLGDLKAKRLRMVSDTALRDDPLRVLRAVRFEGELGYRPDSALRAAMRSTSSQLSQVSAERIAVELERIFVCDALPWSLRRLEQSGALGFLLPELEHCRGVDQRPVHRRDVFWHQYDAVRWIVRLTDTHSPRSAAAGRLWSALQPLMRLPEVRRSLDRWRLPLRLATLLHDIGKPATREVGTDGRTHFYGHSELGANLAETRLRELRMPSRLIEQVRLLIEQHLRPGQVSAPGQPPTDRALHRFHMALGDAAGPLCWLFLADSLATAGPAALLPRWPAYAAHVGRILAWTPQRSPTAPRLLDGHGIMAAAGIGPGPQVGVIQREIDERVALGEIVTAEQARQLARQFALPPA